MVCSQSLRIALIDDEIEFCSQVSQYLSRCGYQVETVSDADKSLELNDQFNPDIVVVDVDLGSHELDGKVLCAAIAQSKHTYAAPEASL